MCWINIHNTSDLVKMTDCNTKITKIESKIPSVTSLVTIAALNTKATDIENKCLMLIIWLTKLL